MNALISELETESHPLASDERFRERLQALDTFLPTYRPDSEGPSLFAPCTIAGHTLRNRLCALPMDGDDADPNGDPSDATLARWARSGAAGVGIVWGEGVAVSECGRKSSGQLLPSGHGFERLRQATLEAHGAQFGDGRPPILGIQLSHAGRWANANGVARPRAAFRHPYLDARSQVDDERDVLTDAELEDIGEATIRAARMAWDAGFDFVDVEQCHGHLFNELLAARSRPGRYGGSLGGRTRLLRRIVAGIQTEAPGIEVAARINLFDLIPLDALWESGGMTPADPAAPQAQTTSLSEDELPYRHGFGVKQMEPWREDPTEPYEVISLLRSLGITMINATGGSPHYCPHAQAPGRDAAGKVGPTLVEDPLLSVSRLLNSGRLLKSRYPDLLCIGSGYSYLGPQLESVARAAVQSQWIDVVGLGRAMGEAPASLPEWLTHH